MHCKMYFFKMGSFHFWTVFSTICGTLKKIWEAEDQEVPILERQVLSVSVEGAMEFK